MSLFLSIYFSLYFLVFLLLVLHFLIWKKEEGARLTTFPKVSVLVAARNEENNILICLQALTRLDYPIDKLEVLIGNDQSEDNTKLIVEGFIKDKPNFHLVDIEDRWGNAKGKANALAHLVSRAKGDFFFITDADIEVPSTWIKGLLEHWQEKIATVSGVTYIRGNRLFDKLQNIDWIISFGMVQSVSERGIPVSAVGNNMMISRKAYEATGGYERIPFSITEDFELFRQTLKKGFGYKNIMKPEVLASSKSLPDLLNLLKQRKRWMSGAFQLPLLLIFCLLLQAVFFPVILLTLVLYPEWGGLLWMCKWILQQVFLALVLKRMNVKESLLKYSLIFEIYMGVLSFAQLLYYLLPGKVVWKGREY